MKARWVNFQGEQCIAIDHHGVLITTLTRAQALELNIQLGRLIIQNPPPVPDNGERDY